MNKNGLYYKIAFHSQKLHNVCNTYYHCYLRLQFIENKKIIKIKCTEGFMTLQHHQSIDFCYSCIKKHSERNMFNVVLQNKKKIGCIIASKELMSKLPELD